MFLEITVGFALILISKFLNLKVQIGNNYFSDDLSNALIYGVYLILGIYVVKSVVSFIIFLTSKAQDRSNSQKINRIVDFALGRYVGATIKKISTSKLFLKSSNEQMLANVIYILLREQVGPVPNTKNEILNHLINYLKSRNEEDNSECIRILDELEKRFGLTEWIYVEMRYNLIQAHKYRKLHSLNCRAPRECNKYFGPQGRNEWTVLDLTNKLGKSILQEEQLRILKEICSYNALTYDMLIQMVNILISKKDWAQARKIIEQNWEQHNSKELGDILIMVLKQNKSWREMYYTVNYYIGKNDSGNTKCLLYKIAFNANMFEECANIAKSLIHTNPALSNLMRLIADLSKGTDSKNDVEKMVDEL